MESHRVFLLKFCPSNAGFEFHRWHEQVGFTKNRYICNPGDVLYVPKNNHIAYECDEKCIIFYAAYPHDWKKKAGLTHVPGIDPEDMGLE